MSPSTTRGLQSKHSSGGFASFCRKGRFAARLKRWPLPGELECTATGTIPVMGGEDNDRHLCLARNKVAGKTDASLALVGKELFIRGHEYQYCAEE